MATGGYIGDGGDYQGHVTAINLSTGAQNVFNSLCSDQTVHFVLSPGTPDCAQKRSAIWAKDGVIYDGVTDRIFMATGNGPFNANTGGRNWGDSVFSLNPDGTGLGGNPLDSYTPTDFASLESSDTDLGSTGPAILPATGYSGRLAVQSGKDSKLRLFDLTNMSANAGGPGPGHVGGEIQLLDVPQGGEVLSVPAVWINPADSSTWVFIANGSGSSGLKLTISGGVPSLAKVWQKSYAGSSPLVANNVLYFAGNSIIRALDPLTGSLLWSDTTHVGGNHWQSPIVFNATLYITDQSSRLTAYALPPAGSPTPTNTPTATATATAPAPTLTATVQPTLTQTPAPTSTLTLTATVPPTLTHTPTPTPAALPDLVVSSVNAPSTGGAGLTIKVADTTHNKSGTGPAGPSTTRYYLSTDTTLDASDTPLGSRSIPALKPGGSDKGSVNVVIPPGTSAGTWYVIAKADADNLLPETNDSNNTSSNKIVIGPDLIVSSFSVPSSSGAGLQISVSDTTKNPGSGSTLVSSTTSFYLSKNSTLGAGDTLLGSRPIGVLAPGASSTQTTMLTIPALTVPGTYYIIANADDGNAVAETLESNNTKSRSIKVGP